MASASAAAPTGDPALLVSSLVVDEPYIVVRHKGLLTFAIMGAVMLQLLDTTVANVALPHMQATFGATLDSISWVLTSYIVASALVIPVTGWLSDRFGPRNLMIGGVAAFIAASMLCGAADSLSMIVVARLIQGASGAFIAPLAQAMLFNINRRADHPKAMSIFAGGSMLAPIAGPVVGGWLTDNFNWRWVFYINVPTGVLCLFLLWWLMPRQETEKRTFDLFGFAMIATGLASFQLLLDRGEHVDWFAAPECWIELGIAISCFWVFTVHLLTARNPLYSPIIFKDRNLLAGTIFTMIAGSILMSTLALLPPMMQTLFGYPVVDAGYVMSTRGLGMLLSMPLVNYLTPRIDNRLIIVLGFSMATAAMWSMTTWTLDITRDIFFWTGLVQGLGLGLVWVPLALIAYTTLDPKYRTEGLSFVNIGRSTGSSMGIAIITSLYSRNVQVSHADLAQHVSAASLPIDPNTVYALGATGSALMGAVDGEINRQAAMLAYIDDFKAVAIAMLITLPLVLLFKPKRP